MAEAQRNSLNLQVDLLNIMSEVFGSNQNAARTPLFREAVDVYKTILETKETVTLQRMKANLVEELSRKISDRGTGEIPRAKLEQLVNLMVDSRYPKTDTTRM